MLSSFHHRTASLSHSEAAANGNGPSGPRWDDGGHYFSKRPGGVTVDAPPTTPPLCQGTPPPPSLFSHYGSYSPIMANRTAAHRPLNNNGARNRSDTDPFILSQISSTPIRQRDPLGTSSAPMERRTLVANGNHAAEVAGGNLMVPGKTRPNAVQRLYGRRGKPMGVGPVGNNNQKNLNQPPVQMIDGSTSSGTDTSDTESDTGSSGCAYGQPLMYGNPAAVHSGAANGIKSSPLPRSKFSFGSLQLEEGEGGEEEEEEEEEEGCYRFTEEDVGGRVFSC